MIYIILILLLCILAMLVGLFLGKNLPERIMYLSSITNYIIILLCFLSLNEGKESFVDIAYIYLLLGFAVNLSITKLYQEKDHD